MRVRNLTLGIIVALASTYFSLLLAEVGLWWRESVSKVPDQILERGMYLPDSTLGVVLKPGYDEAFENGTAKGRVHINSLGNRDDEPGVDGSNRVLLVGDSFTFGSQLDQSETIDSWIERQHPGFDAYNLGVGGYDLPNQLDALARCALPARHVVYLFFYNDFQTPEGQYILDGYRLTRHMHFTDGKTLSEDEVRKLITSRQKPANRAPWPPLRSVLLPQFRSLFTRALRRIRTGPPPDDGYTDLDRDRVVARSVKYTLDMQDLARSRGMGFQVAIVPGQQEVQARLYSKAVAHYVEGLRESGLEPIEILPNLTPGDYWKQDLHFNPHGAKVAAETIYRALPASLKIANR